MNFSLVINHTPWVPARVEALAEMRRALATGPGFCATFINDRDWRNTDWQESKVSWALDQWRWSASQAVTHHVFMTDDLHIMPGFWRALAAMCFQSGEAPIGLLSNHPDIPDLSGFHWYRTRSWLVGPAYVLPHAFLLRFLAWFEAKPDGHYKTPGTKGYANDDSSINEFVSHEGGYTLHPLPTIIEHRADIGSTVGHGDRHSRERLSWRARRWTEPTEGGGFVWREEVGETVRALNEPAWWVGAETAPMLKVGA
jgi:hypothetical protein